MEDIKGAILDSAATSKVAAEEHLEDVKTLVSDLEDLVAEFEKKEKVASLIETIEGAKRDLECGERAYYFLPGYWEKFLTQEALQAMGFQVETRDLEGWVRFYYTDFDEEGVWTRQVLEDWDDEPRYPKDWPKALVKAHKEEVDWDLDTWEMMSDGDPHLFSSCDYKAGVELGTITLTILSLPTAGAGTVEEEAEGNEEPKPKKRRK